MAAVGIGGMVASHVGHVPASTSTSTSASGPTVANLRAYSLSYTDAVARFDAAGMVAATSDDSCPLSLVDASTAVAQLHTLGLTTAQLEAAFTITGVTVHGNTGTVTGGTPAGPGTTVFTWAAGSWHRVAPVVGCGVN